MVNPEGSTRPTLPHTHPRLSPQQNEVLRLLTTGARTAQIAETLCIQQDTVRKHFQRILERLELAPEPGIEARLILMRWAMENRGEWKVGDGRHRTAQRRRRKAG
jgi:DNA-binding NarL/FixJ family response regulator